MDALPASRENIREVFFDALESEQIRALVQPGQGKTAVSQRKRERTRRARCRLSAGRRGHTNAPRFARIGEGAHIAPTRSSKRGDTCGLDYRPASSGQDTAETYVYRTMAEDDHSRSLAEWRRSASSRWAVNGSSTAGHDAAIDKGAVGAIGGAAECVDRVECAGRGHARGTHQTGCR